jgi:hypothetical protein
MVLDSDGYGCREYRAMPQIRLNAKFEGTTMA